MWLPPLGQQSTSSAEVLRAGCTGWCGPKGGAEEPTPPEVWEQAGGFWTLSFWGNAQRVSNIGCFIPGDLLRLKDCRLSRPSPAEPGRSSSCLACLKLLLQESLKSWLHLATASLPPSHHPIRDDCHTPFHFETFKKKLLKIILKAPCNSHVVHEKIWNFQAFIPKHKEPLTYWQLPTGTTTSK